MDIQQTVRRFLLENYFFDDGEHLQEEDSFLESGILDSVGVLELVTFLEKSFNIQIKDEELVPENLDSLKSITAFLENKKGIPS